MPDAEMNLTDDEMQDKALEARARRAAHRAGLAVCKSRRIRSVDNYGEFMLYDPITNRVVAGERFNMTAEQVIDYCQ